MHRADFSKIQMLWDFEILLVCVCAIDVILGSDEPREFWRVLQLKYLLNPSCYKPLKIHINPGKRFQSTYIIIA